METVIARSMRWWLKVAQYQRLCRSRREEGARILVEWEKIALWRRNDIQKAENEVSYCIKDEELNGEDTVQCNFVNEEKKLPTVTIPPWPNG